MRKGSSAATINVGIKQTNARSIIATTVIVIFLLILAFGQIFPFYLQIVTSLQPLDLNPVDGTIYLWPVEFTFSNYADAFIEGELGQGVLNTLIIAFGFTILSAIVILICGYVLAKKRFRGRNAVVFALLLTMMVPGEMLMVTNYQLVSSFGWLSTFAGCIFPGLVNVTGIFLVKAFMDSVPDACIESAKIDGASELRVLFQIVLPMSLPVLSTYFVLTFVAQWNDYLWPMLVMSDQAMYTIQLKLLNFSVGGGWEESVLKAAALITTLLPVVVVYLSCQKKFIGGLNFSGIK